MKKCSKCSIEKSSSDFFVRDKKTGRLHAQCKTCYKEYRQGYYTEHYRQNKLAYLRRAKVRREKMREEFRVNMLEFMAAQVCIDCGEDDIRVLELDHIDPQIKLFTISQAVKLGYKWKDVLLEIKKCRVLCANCHKKRTADQFNWYKAR